jgi:tyrosinase
MRITSLAATALMGAVSAAPLESRGIFDFLETDALAAEGVFKLGLNVALEGYPNPAKCTLRNVAYRREW